MVELIELIQLGLAAAIGSLIMWFTIGRLIMHWELKRWWTGMIYRMNDPNDPNMPILFNAVMVRVMSSLSAKNNPELNRAIEGKLLSYVPKISKMIMKEYGLSDEEADSITAGARQGKRKKGGKLERILAGAKALGIDLDNLI